MRYWLRGGWALDFLQGEITRRHADIDLVTWRRHATRIRCLLARRGYRIKETTIPKTQVNFVKIGQEIGIVFITRNPRGRVVASGMEHWRFVPGALMLCAHRLQDLACRVLSSAELLAEKLDYQRATRKAPRPKDIRSMEILRALVDKARLRKRTTHL